MHLRTIVLAIAATLAVATTAVAMGASVTKDPLRFTLQRADFPDGTSFTTSRVQSQDLAVLDGFKGRAADYQATIPFSSGVDCFESMNQCWFMEGKVFVGSTRGQARKLYGLAKRADGLFSDIPEHRYMKRVRLPAYGNTQFAFLETKGKLKADVVVLRNDVVWQLRIGLFGQAHGSRAAVLAALKTYAKKQKTRVGVG